MCVSCGGVRWAVSVRYSSSCRVDQSVAKMWDLGALQCVSYGAID